MNRVLCSTGAIITKRNGRDFNLLREIVPHIACDGLEFMMYQSWHDQTGALKKVLSDFEVPVLHMTKQIGEWISQGNLADAQAMFRADCALAEAVQSKLLVLHLWSGQASDQHIERNIAAYPRLREIAEKHGLLLTVENVICNQRDPMARMRTLAEEYPDISFTFDTKMAAFHSQLEELYRPENAWLWPHIAHFHVNDYAGGHMDWAHMGVKQLGQGHIDFDRFFAFVPGMGYAGDFTCEATSVNEDGTIRYDELNASLGRIRGYEKEACQ
ncbi:MAG: sugar phosphate isomerase/epimerase [Clostridia bacterium]|nr:sugar phosphate isomerase/epimerase [Clostridia bacterium]